MTVMLDLSADVQARLAAEAARRGMTMDQLIAELANSFPVNPETPTHTLGFVGIGSSTSGRTARDADELLADGFGRS